jgi:NAD(P)-dependent dehydrogenase (short-subunit alcohol dehydrogenase family)
VALAFAERGDTVIATMRNPEAASQRLRERSEIEIAALDVTDPEARRRIVAQVLSSHSRIDALINNAGVLATASIEDAPEALTRHIFDTNFFGPLELVRAVLPHMRAQGGGRIVTITAIGAILSTPLFGAYAASKHALDAAVAILDLEARPFGVRAPSILPGQFKTAIAAKATAPIVTAPYARIANALAASRAEHAADQLADLSEVTQAAIRAVTDIEPQARYLVGVGLAQQLRPILAEFDRLHQSEALRAGLLDK